MGYTSNDGSWRRSFFWCTTYCVQFLFYPLHIVDNYKKALFFISLLKSFPGLSYSNGLCQIALVNIGAVHVINCFSRDCLLRELSR